LYCNRPAVIRYPRGFAQGVPLEDPIPPLPIGKGELLREGDDLLLLAIGTMVAPALELAERMLGEGVSCSVINARFVKPLDQELIGIWANRVKGVVALEEGCMPGGFSSAVAEALADANIHKPLLRCAIADHIVHHGEQKQLLKEEALGPDQLHQRISAFFKQLH